MEVNLAIENLVNHPSPSPSPSPSLGSAPLEVGKFTTSKTLAPIFKLGFFRPLECGFDCLLSDSMAGGWTTNSVSQSSTQSREVQKSASTTLVNTESHPSNDTTMEHLSCPIRHDLLRVNNIQEVDRYAIWNNNNDIPGDVDSGSLF